MLRSSLPAFFDELEKIGEDLMTPAVTAESNLVDGSPAAPWTRRKGYRRLASTVARERPDLNKQAGVFDNFRKTYRFGRVQAGKARRAVEHHALKGFVALPEPVQKALTDPRIMDPADQTTGTVAGNLIRLIRGH